VGVVVRARDGSLVDYNADALRLLGVSDAEMRAPPLTPAPGRCVIRPDGSVLPPEEWPTSVARRTVCDVRGVVLGVVSPSGCAWVTCDAHLTPGGGTTLRFRELAAHERASGGGSP